MARVRARRKGASFSIEESINDLIPDFNRRGGSTGKHVGDGGLGIHRHGF